MLSKFECYIYGLSTLVFTCYYQRSILTFLIAFPECLPLNRNPNRISSTWLPSVGNMIPPGVPPCEYCVSGAHIACQHPCCCTEYTPTLHYYISYRIFRASQRRTVWKCFYLISIVVIISSLSLSPYCLCFPEINNHWHSQCIWCMYYRLWS